jgi:hypothetical protein
MLRKAFGVNALVLTIAAVMFAAAWIAPAGAGQQPAATSEALIEEVRGLREELRQLAGSSIRMQLLVARLQLQEQRIAALSRQQFDTREQLAGVEKARAATEGAAKMFNAGDGAATAVPEPFKIMANELAALRQREIELRSHDTELAAAVAAEQARWSDFNSRLDALEREVEAGVRR